MLVELVLENFYSFREESIFSMVASSIPEHLGTISKTNLFPLCKVSAIYGANASGKSNLLKSLALIQEGVLLEKGKEQEWLDKIKPFHLDARMELEDTLLETSFLLEDVLYRYGFYVNRSEIIEEYLYEEGTESIPYFRRTKEEGLVEGTWLPFIDFDIQSSNRLLLATLFKNTITLPVISVIKTWFESLQIIMDTNAASLTNLKAKFHLKKYKHNLLEILQVADPSIHDLIIREKRDFETGIKTEHFFVIKLKKQLDGSMKPFQEGFLFHDVESAGTVKLLAIAGPIIEALETGSLLLIDEMDQSFHPMMTGYVLDLFRGEFNQKGAQLVFSTHDLSNLRSDLFRRDQVWFVEKKKNGSSELTSLVEFQFDEQERKNSFQFYQNYLNGKYGAVPFVPPADWWVDNAEE